ncbi:MAG: polysaccharide deacetylase family protein [Actinomycetia bacterium]|nr:polysaccharide deacetylase family protein [Actinomycetes bacterium]
MRSLAAWSARWPGVVAGVLAAAAVWATSRPGALALQAPAAPPAVYRVATTTPAVALTVNVVWGTEYVPRLLAVLQREHARATFFLGGAWAAAHPDLVRQLAAAGMEIGNHGYAHRHQSLLSFDANVEEITRASRAIELAGAPRPTLFAPPYGEYNRTVLEAAGALHLTTVMWTIDTIDWRPSSTPDRITERVLSRAAPGSIVLMHPTDRTVEALPRILAGLAAKGLKAVPVGTLLKTGTPQGEAAGPGGSRTT